MRQDEAAVQQNKAKFNALRQKLMEAEDDRS